MSVNRKPQLLLVDDDLRLRALLETYLRREDFDVAMVGNVQQMQQVLLERPVDLMVLDLTLPGGNGLDICRDLRAAGNTLPIVMLTAKGDDIDRILGLEIGADDYLPKPCNPRELAARIRAVLRRRSTAAPGAPSAEAAPIRFGEFCLYPSTRQLTRRDVPISLTTGESATPASAWRWWHVSLPLAVAPWPRSAWPAVLPSPCVSPSDTPPCWASTKR